MKNDGETTHFWYWIDYDGQSVIKNLAGVAGWVRGSLLFPCGNMVTNSSTVERPGASGNSITGLTFAGGEWPA